MFMTWAVKRGVLFSAGYMGQWDLFTSQAFGRLELGQLLPNALRALGGCSNLLSFCILAFLF